MSLDVPMLGDFFRSPLLISPHGLAIFVLSNLRFNPCGSKPSLDFGGIFCSRALYFPAIPTPPVLVYKVCSLPYPRGGLMFPRR